jgi:hypothetical protein
MSIHHDLQEPPTIELLERKDVNIMKPNEDLLLMKNGKMMMKKNGRIKPMKEDMAIFDGMRVMLDGTVIMTDGNARTMMEGDAMTMDGRLTEMVKMEDKETKDKLS